MPTSYLVINIKTQQVVRRFSTAQQARNLRSQLDLQTRGFNFTVRAIYA